MVGKLQNGPLRLSRTERAALLDLFQEKPRFHGLPQELKEAGIRIAQQVRARNVGHQLWEISQNPSGMDQALACFLAAHEHATAESDNAWTQLEALFRHLRKGPNALNRPGQRMLFRAFSVLEPGIFDDIGQTLIRGEGKTHEQTEKKRALDKMRSAWIEASQG